MVVAQSFLSPPSRTRTPLSSAVVAWFLRKWMPSLGSPCEESLRLTISASKDVNTKLGQALATLGPEVRSAFATNPSWTTQVDVHNDDAHPVWAKLLLELLELEDKAVPLTREAVTFVLLATRQRQIDGIEVVGVDEILEDVVILNKLFPTKRQMEWMKQLNLGV